MRLYQPVWETNNDDDDDGTNAHSCAYSSASVFLQWPIGSSRADVLKTLAEGILRTMLRGLSGRRQGSIPFGRPTFILVRQTEYVLRSYIPQQHIVKISYTDVSARDS